MSEEGLEDGLAFLDVEHQQVRVAVVEKHLQRHRTKQVPPTQDLFAMDKLTDDDDDDDDVGGMGRAKHKPGRRPCGTT